MIDEGVFTQIDVPFEGATNTSAAGINNKGDIVGDFVLNGNTAGFEFSDGKYTVFDQPPCFCAAPYGINNRGEQPRGDRRARRPTRFPAQRWCLHVHRRPGSL